MKRLRPLLCAAVMAATLALPTTASAVTYLSGGLYPEGGTEYSLGYWYSNSMNNSNSPYAGHKVHLRLRWYNGSLTPQHLYQTSMPAIQYRNLSSYSYPGCWRVSTAAGGGSGYYTGYSCSAVL